MHLGDGSATFDLNYSLETFTRLYVLALGCRYLEPDLLTLFSGCEGVKILKADTNCAAVQVTAARKYIKGRYIFDPLPPGPVDVIPIGGIPGGIPRFTVIYPEGRACTFYNVSSLQSVFWEAEAFSQENPSESSNGSIEGMINGSQYFLGPSHRLLSSALPRHLMSFQVRL